MELKLIFQVVVSFCALQRLVELFIAKKNESWIIDHGGKVLKETNYAFMVILHTSWILGLLYHAFFTPNKLIQPPLFWLSLSFFVLGQILRWHAITTLGKRWSTRVCVLPEAPVVKSGLFKWIKHPNYLGVILELFFLPMAMGLWKIALIFSVLNGIILFFRIRFEERMLCEFNDYEEKFLKPL
jgi:methyltransferase